MIKNQVVVLIPVFDPHKLKFPLSPQVYMSDLKILYEVRYYNIQNYQSVRSCSRSVFIRGKVLDLQISLHKLGKRELYLK